MDAYKTNSLLVGISLSRTLLSDQVAYTAPDVIVEGRSSGSLCV